MKKIKNNNKGFMLIEVVIVTVVVVTIMTSLYIVFNRVYNAYDKKSTYTDVNSIYALKMIKDYMIDIESNNTFMLDNLVNSNTTFTSVECSTENTSFNSYCDSIYEEYNVNEMYIVKNNEASLNSLKNNVTNQTFKEYIEYLVNIGVYKSDYFEDGAKYSDLLIIETHSIDSGDKEDKKILNKYAYLPVADLSRKPRNVPNGDTSGANVPVMNMGMIPVYYNETIGNWVVADIFNEKKDWYDYDNQKWANAVLVTDEKRNSLKKDTYGDYEKDQLIGDSIEDGVLAFYVWIPRYKYKLFNVEKTMGFDSYDAYNKGVDIVLEKGIESTGTVNCTIAADGTESCTNAVNGNYYTHPAFTFGDEELAGFWMGKFEVTGSVDNPTILPNVVPVDFMNNRNLLTFYNMAKKITDASGGYGITNTNYDSHIIKTSEWGAVAFFTHSKYGKCADGTCEEVGLNDSYCSKNKIINYSTSQGLLTSTTGNIYGVYNMNGSCWEQTMGVLIYKNGSVSRLVSGNDNTYNSGFNGFLIDYNSSGNIVVSNKSDGVTLEEKYYDRYLYNYDAWGVEKSHLGDAIGEVLLEYTWLSGHGWKYYSWFNDYAYFPYDTSSYSGLNSTVAPWLVRSGNGAHGNVAGIFFSQSSSGFNASANDEANSTRYVLTMN